MTINKQNGLVKNMHTLVFNCPACGCYIVSGVKVLSENDNELVFEGYRSVWDKNHRVMRYDKDETSFVCQKCGHSFQKENIQKTISVTPKNTIIHIVKNLLAQQIEK